MDNENKNRKETLDIATRLRVALKTFEEELIVAKNQLEFQDPMEDLTTFDRREVIANLTISYRCVQDARMRLGKVMQAANGGVSIYDN